MKNRVVVYSCLTGNYDQLNNHSSVNPDWDLCFVSPTTYQSKAIKIQGGKSGRLFLIQWIMSVTIDGINSTSSVIP
jgi:hypothetical protein